MSGRVEALRTQDRKPKLAAVRVSGENEVKSVSRIEVEAFGSVREKNPKIVRLVGETRELLIEELVIRFVEGWIAHAGDHD